MSPQDTQLEGSKGAECVLQFSNSALLFNLSILSSRGSCVVHSGGQLRIERCRLTCVPEGRGYIYCCVASLASDVSRPMRKQFNCNKRKKEQLQNIGPGVLTLSDTVCSSTDTNSVVHCRGTGQLRNVRMIVRKSKRGEEECYMWWTIDSSVPGTKPPSKGLQFMRNFFLGDDGEDVQQYQCQLQQKRRKLSSGVDGFDE
eukprot:TRINITY_DN13342_c0_g2_i7.p2 TRINITY_DN13342_c0_g2~~TRINITY_DN13342_c0_g2_i7.p2  ORF type:complete len:200 (-),score=23.03 TRINITY_DN13342_c0_g2_i7:205-804(-)